MFVACLRLDLRLHGTASLKAKRSVLRRLTADLRRLDVAVAEVGHHDLWQRTTLGIAAVATEQFHTRRVLHQAEQVAERDPSVEVLDAHVAVYGPEDE